MLRVDKDASIVTSTRLRIPAELIRLGPNDRAVEGGVLDLNRCHPARMDIRDTGLTFHAVIPQPDGPVQIGCGKAQPDNRHQAAQDRHHPRTANSGQKRSRLHRHIVTSKSRGSVVNARIEGAEIGHDRQEKISSVVAR